MQLNFKPYSLLGANFVFWGWTSVSLKQNVHSKILIQIWFISLLLQKYIGPWQYFNLVQIIFSAKMTEIPTGNQTFYMFHFLLYPQLFALPKPCCQIWSFLLYHGIGYQQYYKVIWQKQPRTKHKAQWCTKSIFDICIQILVI